MSVAKGRGGRASSSHGACNAHSFCLTLPLQHHGCMYTHSRTHAWFDYDDVFLCGWHQSAAAVDADADANTDTNANTGTAESSPSTGILSKAKRNAMVIIGSDPRPVEFNSVVILPRLITADECHVLVDSCDQRCNYLKYFASLNPALPTDGSRWHAMHRVPVKDLSSKEAKELSTDILFNRPVLCQYFALHLAA